MNIQLIYGLLAGILLSGMIACQSASTDTTSAETAPVSGYDAALAAKTGADPYGMKQYVMAYLKAGPNRNLDSLESVNLQRAHMDNIGKMAEAGKLVLAGPFLDDGETRGIYLFNVATLEEAEALTATDPAIQAGSLVMELHPWYGSAALMEVNEIHKRLAKEDI